MDKSMGIPAAQEAASNALPPMPPWQFACIEKGRWCWSGATFWVTKCLTLGPDSPILAFVDFDGSGTE
jgi:hypothetical protein